MTDIEFDGRRATGVSVDIGGETKEFTGREIIVSLGGIHSPAMLMRCGIGPAAHLREHGIAVRADMPGVGANLSNHSLLFIGFHLQPEARQSPSVRPHSATVLRYSSGVPGCPPHRHVHQRAEQDLVERARPRGSPISRRRCGSRWAAAAWRCARRTTGRSRWSR